MILHLKRDKSNLNSRYLIYNAEGIQRYAVLGKFVATGEHLYLYQNDEVVLRIHEAKFPGDIVRAFKVYLYDSKFHILIARLPNSLELRFTNLNISVSGDLMSKNISISDSNGKIIAFIKNRFDSYLELEIQNEEYEKLVISIAIAINSINYQQDFIIQNA